MQSVDPLIGNESETRNETAAFAMQRPAQQWTGWKAVISALSAPMAEPVTVNTTMRSAVFYVVRAEGLQARQSLELSDLWDTRQTVTT